MNLSLPRRRPPSLLEQLVGRRRARMLRRRLGLASLGLGYSLLKPRSRLLPAATVAGAAALVFLLVVA